LETAPTDVAVVGAGAAGLTAALALVSAGASVTLVGRPGSDNRTTALLATSVTALETLGVWKSCGQNAAPLEFMRIVDDTGRLWRAPEVKFSAREIEFDAFGWNIENRFLVEALSRKISITANIVHIVQSARGVEFDDDFAVILLESGDVVRTRLAVGAEGHRSICRDAAGIATEGWSYPQTAVTMNFAHTRPHENTSTEFHTATGPFTVVPLPGNRSSLVWAVKPADADRLAALGDADLNTEIERRSHSILGKIAVEPGRGKFPLRMETAKSFGAHRVVLVGEAAHILPPIGAQGFNLGLRDVATIAELVAEAKHEGRDVGSATLTTAYHSNRQADTKSRTIATDLLNRSLLSDFLPVQGARGLGLYMMKRIGPLRRAMMREGVAPSRSLPKLMRGEAP
jgi:2-octaprenyl-6-methoxyphenol hydroxylase